MNLTKPQKLIYDMEKFAGGAISVICGSMLCCGKREVGELAAAVNMLYRINDALRIRISETDGVPEQTVTPYHEKKIEVLHFETKAELDTYAQKYATEPVDMFGNLCEIKIVLLPEQYGILAKLHHIVGDAWSLSLLGNQFNAILSGETPEAYSYADYVTAENEYLGSKRYGKDKAFFLEQFSKCDEVTYLSEKQSKTYAAKRKTFVIGKDKTAEILNYAESHETTAFTLFTAALSAYMNRTKMNAEKFYIGTAVLNRTTAKEKQTVGMFINTVPMLMELDNNKTFAENLTAIQDIAFSVFRHQKYNYGDVLSTLRAEHNFGEKLYDVMLSFQNATVEGEIESTWYTNGEQTESLQIHIEDRDVGGIFHVHFDYLTEKFTEHEIDKLFEHITNLLYSAIQDDSKKLYELDILSADERQKLLAQFNDTAADYPKDKCIHQLFEEQVERTPDKVALIACDKTLTYKELNEEANRIAHSLTKKGVSVGDIVAFALPKKSYLIATMLGILKSGAAYLPIDPDYPQDRIDYMLSDSNAKLFIMEDNITELLSNKNTVNPDIAMQSNSLCYCIYTSGSTGKPKGTLLKHSGIVNLITHLGIYKDLSHCKRIGFMTTVTFDVATQEILTAYLNGFTGALMPERKMTGSDEIIDGIIENQIDVMYATPTYFDSLTDTDEKAEKLLSAIKVVALAGEKFYLNAHVLKFKDKYNVIFENQYGPAEVHVITTTTIEPNEVDIHIGKPIANTQIYIVDKFMHPTPIGVTGELCIAGDGVGAGYLNRPELTAEKFIDNPFGAGKLYKTGDLAYWREDGNIAYVGRNDFQVKIRGLRIELGEIENAISAVDGIQQAVVVVRKNNEGRQLICAFYTGKETDAKEIRTQIGKKLPKYMLPHIFTHLDTMPLTASGKINRKALPEIDLYNIDSDTEYEAPQTEKETVLVNAIEDILGIEKVGILDNFFDLGGDSLKAIELISKLQRMGYDTETKTIFECETVKELAEKLTQNKEPEEIAEIIGDIPATAAQMRVYTAQSVNANSTTYNVPYAFKVENLDAEKLQKAVDGLIARHESLRTHFENKDGKIIQVIEDRAECKVEKLSSDDISAFIRSFDLSKAPLLRAGYYKNTVMIDMHHIITDGGSMPVILRELNELYMERPLLSQPIQYKRFALLNHDLAEDEKYWLSVYGDEIPALEINTDFKRPNKQSFNGNAVYDSVDIKLHKRIFQKCKELNITPFHFYMGGFNILLSKFSGNEDIIVGMPVSGRGTKYLDTVGMFVNTVALRNKPEGNKTVTEFLEEVKESSVKAIEHQNYPYGELVKKLGLESGNRNPLFDVMFAYQSEQMTDVIFGDKKAELLPIPITTSKYDFTFNIMPRENDVVIMAEYCTDLYKENTITRLINGYKQILEQLLNAEKCLNNLSVIMPEEQQKLLAQFNDTAVDYPKYKCVHELFEEQVEKTPDKVALIAYDKTLTYRELNEEANRIAHSLIAKGVGVRDIVAFALPRKSYLIATMLGILKSGAAYLPIDPDYPQDRIDYMLSDSNAKLFVMEDNISQLLSNKTTTNPTVAMSSNRLCYCIYTSGSTGKPKGVLLSHHNVANYINNNNNNNVVHAIIDKTDYTIVSVTTCGFDIFVTESLLPLVNGMEIVFANENQAKIQSELNALLTKYPADVLQTTPSKMKTLIADKKQLDYLKKLKVIILGGEALDELLVKQLQEYTDANIFNIYGPTETTVWSTNKKILSDIDISIGKPIANTQIYIVDKYMLPTPIGVTGELCIAGDGVGAGYLNRPELTAEKFIDNPFGEGKLYKTGDLAYWREDGNIVYVGRNDFQVKIRGLRIELGEIENAISSVDGIQQSVVVVRKNNEGRQLICAFYTGKETDVKEIRTQIGKKLPKYMLPHIFTHLSEMPLTASGKINRKALPEIDLYNIDSDTEYVAPTTELQKALCKMVEEVLGTSPVGITDDFFSLGGDSLKSIEYVSMAHNDGIYFALQNVFDYPTVKELCECIENGDKQQISFADVDFSTVNSILAKNTVENITVPEKTDVGNILLAGATGYLGIHILADFLDNDTGMAYCIVRGKDTADSEKRLMDLLSFYFGEKFAGDKRIKVFCGDLSQDKFGLSDSDYAFLLENADTVINCAASVKHYGSYKYFYEVNVESTKRLIAFTKEANARLIHTSTLSVSGNSFADEFTGYICDTEKHFYESTLYFGQPLDNVYARSKFEAEKAVLDAMADGLPANIMRMGNLTNRYCDGMFQKNYQSNAFLNRVKGVLELGIFPEYLMQDTNYAEFTPIDEAANAVMTIARHFSTQQTVFHINSIKVVYFSKLLECFNKLGFNLNTVDGSTFTDALRATAKQTGMEHIFETFINDMDENDTLNYDSNIRIENDFTVKYLKNLGFEWKDIDLEYLRKYVEYFKRIGYFGGTASEK